MPPRNLPNVCSRYNEAARYNAGTIVHLADLLSYELALYHDTRALVAALDAAISIQIMLSDLLFKDTSTKK